MRQALPERGGGFHCQPGELGCIMGLSMVSIGVLAHFALIMRVASVFAFESPEVMYEANAG